MASPKEEAAAFKDKGNAAVASRDWNEAISLYSKAIELDATVPAYFSNRAHAYIKTEAYGYAIIDATKAIDLDPNFVKASHSEYRDIKTEGGLEGFQDGSQEGYVRILAAFKQRTILNRARERPAPNNQDARLKLLECEKMVQKAEFLKAIEVGDPPSAAEGLDVDGIKVEDSYEGMELGEEMTLEFVKDMTERFKNGKKLHKKYVYRIILKCKEIFFAESTMPDVTVEKGNRLTICGDTHGQYFDLLEIFNKNGYPSEKHAYLFNGDFVDRGSWSTEIALLLFAYKWLYPKGFFINRGNHEADQMNKVYGFEGECKAKYSERVYKLFSETFSALPLAHLIGEKYLVLHGGLFSDDKYTLDDIRKLDRHAQRQPGNEGLMMEMLWTDPQTEPGRGPSKRGVGLQFGPDVTKRFCEKNGLEAVIRSHEVRMGGYEQEHDGRCITVFSAPNYCDSTGNKGAYINVGEDYKLDFVTFDAVPHPNIKPMAYAQNSLMQMM
ncbi:hypothetical protein H072_8668 [Dactylellina haptotyla CBS 200.50]|uniref:Serine/threonine-protein phosphatase n=1 Tax=Dactylellina haptotyla (strain CBS 200.50) TaxID=1284197 RepID=S8A4E2_DACHA|nr:hypothetical protein H072_8668 [Dactylellina haptotyla CBS 200.50]